MSKNSSRRAAKRRPHNKASEMPGGLPTALAVPPLGGNCTRLPHKASQAGFAGRWQGTFRAGWHAFTRPRKNSEQRKTRPAAGRHVRCGSSLGSGTTSAVFRLKAVLRACTSGIRFVHQLYYYSKLSLEQLYQEKKVTNEFPATRKSFVGVGDRTSRVGPCCDHRGAAPTWAAIFPRTSVPRW